MRTVWIEDLSGPDNDTNWPAWDPQRSLHNLSGMRAWADRISGPK